MDPSNINANGPMKPKPQVKKNTANVPVECTVECKFAYFNIHLSNSDK